MCKKLYLRKNVSNGIIFSGKPCIMYAKLFKNNNILVSCKPCMPGDVRAQENAVTNLMFVNKGLCI